MKIKAEKDGLYWTIIDSVEIFGVVVEKGFITDGASVPRFLWWFLHPAGLAFEAAIVHDWRHHGGLKIPRKYADDEFFHNLRKSQIGRFRSYVVWLCVRIYAKTIRLK